LSSSLTQWFLSSDEHRLYGLRPVPLLWVDNFNSLSTQLSKALNAEDTSIILYLGQKILDLHPRIDSVGAFGFPISDLDPKTIIDALTVKLVELNTVKPPTLRWTFDNPTYVPPFDADSEALNQLANLTYALEDFNAAYAVLKVLDYQSVLLFTARLRDLQKGNDERLREDNHRFYWEEYRNLDI